MTGAVVAPQSLSACRVGGGRWAAWSSALPRRLFVGRTREEAVGLCYLAAAVPFPNPSEPPPVTTATPPPAPPADSFGPVGLTPATARRWLYAQQLTGRVLAVIEAPPDAAAVDAEVLRVLALAPDLLDDVRHAVPRLDRVAGQLAAMGWTGLAGEVRYCASLLRATAEGGAS